MNLKIWIFLTKHLLTKHISWLNPSSSQKGVYLRQVSLYHIPFTREYCVFNFCYLDDDLFTKPTLTPAYIVMTYDNLLYVSKVNTRDRENIHLKIENKNCISSPHYHDNCRLDKDMPKLDYFSSDRWFQQLLKLPEYRRSSLISLPRS